MSQSATIDSAGRIVVPVSVRRRLNLAPGSRLRLEVVAERIELTPEAEPEPLVRQGTRLVLKPSDKPGTTRSIKRSTKRSDAAAQVRAEREAQARRDAGR